MGKETSQAVVEKKKPVSKKPVTVAGLLRARVGAAAAEARRRGEASFNKSEYARKIRSAIEEEVAARRAAREKEEGDRPRNGSSHIGVHSAGRGFHQLVNAGPERPAAPDSRKLRRQARVSKSLAIRGVTQTPRECIEAAREHLKEKQTGAASRLLSTAAENLGSHDPMRFEVAEHFAKAGCSADAIDVLKPLLGHEVHGEKTAGMVAVFQLAQGHSRVALEILKHAKPMAGPHVLKAAAELSWALRTDDAAACDKALAQLDQAKFINTQKALLVDLSAYEGQPGQVRLSAGTLGHVNALGEALVRSGRLYEAVNLYDTLRPGQPTCASERQGFIRALKSCGSAYYEYGLANRKALAQVSIPPSPSVAWGSKKERTGLARTAEDYLNLAFKRFFRAFELDGTDRTLRDNLAKVIELTGDPDHFEKVNARIHRRQKSIAGLQALPNDAAIIEQLSAMSYTEELSREESRLLRQLRRNRNQAIAAGVERQALLDLLTEGREVTDKPAHMPTAQARSRRFFKGPRC